MASDESELRPSVWHCPACGKRNEHSSNHCVYCAALKPARSAPGTTPPQPAAPSIPGLAIMFRFLAVLEIIGGLIMCGSLWPGEAGEGYQWKAVAYVPALTWLMAGLIFGCLFL